MASLLGLQPQYEADMTAFEMRHACAETNKIHFTCIHKPAVPRGIGTLGHMMSPAQQRNAIIFSKQKCWSNAVSGNTFNLLADLSSFLKKIPLFDLLL